MPHVYEALARETPIHMPQNWKKSPLGFCGAQFLIDCTDHPRHRVHPGQHLYYRGDKGYHFLTSQIITCPRGLPFDVVIGLGHNNDKGMYKLSGTKELFEHMNIMGLADRGYQNVQLIRPDNLKLAKHLSLTPEKFSSRQAQARSPGEIINGVVKFYSFASQPVSQSPEFQAFALMIIYHLTTLTMINAPTWFLTRLTL